MAIFLSTHKKKVRKYVSDSGPRYVDIQGAHAPLHPCKAWRDKVMAAEQVGLHTPPNPPPLAQRGSWNMWAVNSYQSLSRALNTRPRRCKYEKISNTPHHLHVSQNANHQLSDIQVPNLCWVNIGNYTSVKKLA